METKKVFPDTILCTQCCQSQHGSYEIRSREYGITKCRI